MKSTSLHLSAAVLLAALGAGPGSVQAAAPSTPQGFITGKAFYGITGTAVTDLTNKPQFPDRPDDLFIFPYFEWAATGDITVPPGDFADNYGGQIVGYFYPPSTGDYIFWIAADDNAALYLSPDADPGNKKLIARESAWSNEREYTVSGGGSDLTAKDSTQFTATEWADKDPLTGGARITLQGGQPYYIEALFKEGTGGDDLSVAVQDPNFAIDPNSPIPGEYLSSDRTQGPVTISVQPQSQTVDERGSVTFQVVPDGTPPYAIQWRKNGTDVPDATNLTYTATSVATTDNNAAFSVVITGAEGTATSQDAVLTVTPDTALPTILAAKGNPNLTAVDLTFSEPVDATSAATTANYQVSSSGGSLNVTDATLSASGTVVTLTTAPQTLGTKYTVLVSNVRDTAATPNTIAADSKAVFFPTGKLMEVDGFIVFEAEHYDRNLDDLWIKDTERGNPSGGVSMVNPNGAGGSQYGTQLEYDVEFSQAGTYYVWYRASGDNGNDDSGWFHLDGDKPAERFDGNQASMTGFQPQADFVWRSDSQDGPDPFTVDIPAPGPHVIGLGRREDGSFFDKFVLTTDASFTPTGFGPPETREGIPELPTISLTGPTTGQTFAGGATIPLTATAEGATGLEIARVIFTANGEPVGEAVASPFSVNWANAPAGIFAIRATAIDEIGGMTTSTNSVVITIGTPPPQALLVVGTASDPNLNASDAGLKTRLESKGWQVSVVQAPASTTADADGKQLVIVSSTVNSGDVGDKFRTVTAPVIAWEQAVQDNFLMTLDSGSDRGTLDAQTQINIVKADHPLAAGLSTGPVTVTTAALPYSWGIPNANAVIIATIAEDPTQAVIYGYEKGAMLIDDTTPAPERRVMFFPGDDGFAAFTDDALKLFDAAIAWASGIEGQPPADGPEIAWISFHPADDTPSTDAANAGFTEAADVAYTDLLKSNGYSVTRMVTSGTPDSALLNAFDLVIISRSVPSSDYQSASSTAAWNGITAPTMILGGYVLRGSRLGFVTGDAIPDTAGPVKLTALEPSHPIFEGVALDGSNMMVNDYADLVTFNGTVQRGISVVTDPVAEGGQVLATIGTAEDPAVGGLVIGEWEAGEKLANGSADTLGGHRLVFLTGSREVSGLTSQGAGIYDLEADGAKLFLNAVKYMAGSGEPPTGAELAIARDAGNVTVQWTGGGTLESATSVTGPWTPVSNATSPHSATISGAAQFFRVRQ